jgi:hypothetical protein
VVVTDSHTRSASQIGEIAMVMRYGIPGNKSDLEEIISRIYTLAYNSTFMNGKIMWVSPVRDIFRYVIREFLVENNRWNDPVVQQEFSKIFDHDRFRWNRGHFPGIWDLKKIASSSPGENFTVLDNPLLSKLKRSGLIDNIKLPPVLLFDIPFFITLMITQYYLFSKDDPSPGASEFVNDYTLYMENNLEKTIKNPEKRNLIDHYKNPYAKTTSDTFLNFHERLFNSVMNFFGKWTPLRLLTENHQTTIEECILLSKLCGGDPQSNTRIYGEGVLLFIDYHHYFKRNKTDFYYAYVMDTGTGILYNFKINVSTKEKITKKQNIIRYRDILDMGLGTRIRYSGYVRYIKDNEITLFFNGRENKIAHQELERVRFRKF